MLTSPLPLKHPPVKMFVQAGTVGLHISSIRQEDPSALTLNDVRLAMLADNIFAREFPESSASLLKDAKKSLTERTTAFAKSWIPGSTIVAHNKLPSRPPEDVDATPLPVPLLASVTLSDDLEPINDTDIQRYLIPLYSHKWLVNIAHLGTSKNLRLSRRFDFQDDEFFTSIVAFLNALTQFGSSNNVEPFFSSSSPQYSWKYYTSLDSLYNSSTTQCICIHIHTSPTPSTMA